MAAAAQVTHHAEHPASRGRTGSQRTRLINLAIRVAAIALLISGAAIGVSDPLAIVLIALGVLLVILLRSRGEHGPRHV